METERVWVVNVIYQSVKFIRAMEIPVILVIWYSIEIFLDENDILVGRLH